MQTPTRRPNLLINNGDISVVKHKMTATTRADSFSDIIDPDSLKMVPA